MTLILSVWGQGQDGCLDVTFSGGPVDLQIVGNTLRNNIVARIEKGPSTPREKENCVCQFALRLTHTLLLTPALRSKAVKGRNYVEIFYALILVLIFSFSLIRNK
jgi:hypothetical protein